jgi:peptidyl-prolyl cis-trans isomerase SurA
MINLLLREEVYGKVSNDDFSDDDLTEYFGTHKEEFVVPEKVHVKRIFVAISNQRPAPEAESIAKALFAQVSGAPDTFRDVASESSDGPFKRRGGDLGYISDDGKPGIPSEVTNRAFKMEVGEISEPFLAAGGYNILSIPNRRERLERTFEQMRGSVLRRMKNDRYDSLSTEYVDTLEEGSAIEVMDAALENYTPIPNARPSMALPTGGLPSAVQPGALPVPIPDAALEGDEMAPSGEPRTGDPIRDLGDANDEAREMLEEALNEE